MTDYIHQIYLDLLDPYKQGLLRKIVLKRGKLVLLAYADGEDCSIGDIGDIKAITLADQFYIKYNII